MKVLSIGNSFSCDAQRYLHRIAKKDGVQLKTVNLFIGGCSLRTHYLNALQDAAAYLRIHKPSRDIKRWMKPAEKLVIEAGKINLKKFQET